MLQLGGANTIRIFYEQNMFTVCAVVFGSITSCCNSIPSEETILVNYY